MDIAVLADIHSNNIALKTCIDYALQRGVEHFLLLGDYISDCPYPQETMRILYELQKKYHCWFIRGNREEYMIDYRANGEKGWFYSSACGCLLYTYESLTDDDIDFFEGLDSKGRLELAGLPTLTICHGSPTSSRELLYADQENTINILKQLETRLLICAHTHIQGTFTYGDKRMINPGSVGIPWYHNGKTQFAILHGEDGDWKEEFLQLEYDLDTLMREYKESGLEWKAPMWTVIAKEVIKTGVDHTIPILTHATNLCKEETGEANWPHIPEKYWEQAAREKGIVW